jgi:zinc/manganese transport system substrate-binding protein
VVITNGLGYDDFMNKLMNASSNGHRQDIEAAAIMNVNGPDANPHLWYDIQQIPAMSSAIESAFASKDPADQQYFAKNLQTFDDSLAPIEKEINLIKEDDPHAPVAYTERVPGYMLSDAGLDIRTPIGFATSIEDGNDPSPADTVAMDSLITGHHIQALLYNVQTVSAVTQHVQGLARQYGIPVVGVSETLPGNEPSYQSWMLDQVTALHEALHGK